MASGQSATSSVDYRIGPIPQSQPAILPLVSGLTGVGERIDLIAWRIIDSDAGEIYAFLRRNGLGCDPAWIPSPIEGGNITAKIEERVVGVARSWRYWLHPARWRLAIYVDRDHRRQGIGSMLLDALIERMPDDGRDLQVATIASNVAGIGFLTRHGFRPLMSTRIGTLEPSGVSQAWIGSARDARDHAARDGLRLASLAERPDLFAQVATAHEIVYRDQHTWNPLVALSHEQAVELFLSPDELDTAMQVLALSGDAICGIASLRMTSQPDVLELGWTATIDQPADRSSMLLRAMIGACFAALGGRQVTIDLELDCLHVGLNALVDTLPVAWDDDWLTFARSSPGNTLGGRI